MVIRDWCRLDGVTQSHSKTPTYTPFCDCDADCDTEAAAGAATPPPYEYEGVHIWWIVMLAIEY